MAAKDVELRAMLTLIYTLTPTHCGTGQATSAVDLPIAREAHTGFPVLPATSLKGVARDRAEREHEAEQVEKWFGPGTGSTNLQSGRLVFTEGRLVALPVRSLNLPFAYCTSRLLLERWTRDLKAAGVQSWLPSVEPAHGETEEVWVADPALGRQSLVVEDLVFPASQVRSVETASAWAKALAEWIPAVAGSNRDRFVRQFAILPDLDMQELARRAVPVQARNKLGEGKTTTDNGNLWYEELLPSDCLFGALILHRPRAADDLDAFQEWWGSTRYVQIGGNETVGQGICLWNRVAVGG